MDYNVPPWQFSLFKLTEISEASERADDPVPRTPEGAVAWAQVTKVRIVFLGDYHG